MKRNILQIYGFENSGNDDIRKWSSYRYLVLSLWCWTVGVSNCWRTPVVLANNALGGGAFLLVCLLMVVLCSIPLMFMELAVGQYSNRGFLEIWQMCPIWKGAGWGSLFVLIAMTFYYNTINVYLLHYTVLGITRDLPWTRCDKSWAKENCFTLEANNSVREACKAKHVGDEKYCDQLNWENSASHYWNVRVLNRLSTGKLGTLQPELLYCNLASLLVIFLCLRKGTKSLEKCLLFFCVFPYLGQIPLLFVSLIHPGSLRGLSHFFKTDYSKLKTFCTWRIAMETILISIGVGLGGLITIGSQSGFRSAAHMESIAFHLIDIANWIIFSIFSFNCLGTLSYVSNTSVEEILEKAENLLFINIPSAINYWPGYSHVWVFMFYSCVYITSMRSQVLMVLTILNIIYDTYPKIEKYSSPLTLVVCIVIFLADLIYFTQAGVDLLNDFHNLYSSIVLLFCVLIETVGIMWIYGVNNFVEDVQFMLGIRVSLYWQLSWLLTPFLILAMLGDAIYNFFWVNNELSKWLWVRILQYILLTTPIVIMVVYLIWYIVKSDCNVIKSFKPHVKWGPVDPILKKSRGMFTAHSMTKEYMYRQNRLKSRKIQPAVTIFEEEQENNQNPSQI